MKNLQFCCLLLLLVLGLAKGDDSNEDDDRIIGGRRAVGRVIYQASLRNTLNQHVCSGAILKENWIVTSARCVLNNIVRTVRVGSNLRNGGILINVRRQVIHPRFIGNSFAFDIALIETARNMTFNRNVGSVSVGQFGTGPNYPLRVTGWGFTSVNGPVANELQQLDTRTLDLGRCRLMTRLRLTQETLCTFTRVGEGNCNLDGGNPCVTNNNILMGIAVRFTCGEVPDINVNIASTPIWSWLESTMGGL